MINLARYRPFSHFLNLVEILGVQAVAQPREIAYTFLADGEREERHLNLQ